MIYTLLVIGGIGIWAAILHRLAHDVIESNKPQNHDASGSLRVDTRP